LGNDEKVAWVVCVVKACTDDNGNANANAVKSMAFVRYDFIVDFCEREGFWLVVGDGTDE